MRAGSHTRRPLRRQHRLFHESACPIGPTGGVPRNPRDLRGASICRNRRTDEATEPTLRTCGASSAPIPAASSRPPSRRTCRSCRRHGGRKLVALAPDLILASGGVTMQALLQPTRTVPIVFLQVLDPVGAGYVESLARPGGNVTGFTNFKYGMSGKWLELIKQIMRGGPSRSRRNQRDRPVCRNPSCGAVLES